LAFADENGAYHEEQPAETQFAETEG